MGKRKLMMIIGTIFVVGMGASTTLMNSSIQQEMNIKYESKVEDVNEVNEAEVLKKLDELYRDEIYIYIFEREKMTDTVLKKINELELDVNTDSSFVYIVTKGGTN